MGYYSANSNRAHPVRVALLVVVAILITLFVISWLMTRGVEDSPKTDTSAPQPVQTVPVESTNPNVTGGSSGAGTNTSNDPNVQSPSPAGGVATNQVPAGGTSPAQ